MTEKQPHDQIVFTCQRKSVQTPRSFKHSRQTQHWLWYDTGMKSKHSFQRERKNGHIVLLMNKEKKKTNTFWRPSHCGPQSISQQHWCQFSKCCANKILHLLHLWGLRTLESCYQIHLFTEVFGQKLYKHSYTIEIGVLCNWHPFSYGPNVTIFTALNLNVIPPNQACREGKINYKIIKLALIGSLTF